MRTVLWLPMQEGYDTPEDLTALVRDLALEGMQVAIIVVDKPRPSSNNPGTSTRRLALARLWHPIVVYLR